ncbi:MAG: hypothetical protein CL675_06295 [Bdellovibrionaceae bacterium]|nr:hypothetical protein [Pseudobdellovibrionaceae bacterium]|tara:strand:- start:385 stop:579 length:195 start_codon:yes stop_codon:yes gene_type:complete
MGLLSFLFGKSADIFDDNGQVRHKLPEDKWEKWQQRYFSSPEMNWRNHTGMKANAKKNKSQNQR